MNQIRDFTDAFYAQVALVLGLVAKLDPDATAVDMIAMLREKDLDLHAVYKQYPDKMTAHFIAQYNGKRAQLSVDMPSHETNHKEQ